MGTWKKNPSVLGMAMMSVCYMDVFISSVTYLCILCKKKKYIIISLFNQLFHSRVLQCFMNLVYLTNSPSKSVGGANIHCFGLKC